MMGKNRWKLPECLFQWQSLAKSFTTFLQRLVPPSITWKKLGWWFLTNTHPTHLCIWLVQKRDESWRMTVNYCKHNQGVTPIAAAVSVMVWLLEGINTLLDFWYAPVDLTNYPYHPSVPASKNYQKQFAFSWQGQQYTFTVLPWGYINFPI